MTYAFTIVIEPNNPGYYKSDKHQWCEEHIGMKANSQSQLCAVTPWYEFLNIKNAHVFCFFYHNDATLFKLRWL